MADQLTETQPVLWILIFLHCVGVVFCSRDCAGSSGGLSVRAKAFGVVSFWEFRGVFFGVSLYGQDL